MNIVLASASPRRKQLLEQVGLTFCVQVSAIQEIVDETEKPHLVAEQLALVKAQDVAQKVTDSIVIGADTIVVKGGQILGKPTTTQEAKSMLMRLSNSTHSVITGLAIIDQRSDKIITTHESTTVHFRKLYEEEVDRYISSGEPMDKAGAYGIQGKAAVFVNKIEGCYFNVVGLPLYELSQLLKDLGIAVV